MISSVKSDSPELLRPWVDTVGECLTMDLRKWIAALVLFLSIIRPGLGISQELSDLDYDKLSFRGLGVEWGKIYPTRVNQTEKYGVRVDLGYLGPGLRILPGISYWSSPLTAREIVRLEERLSSLVRTQAEASKAIVDLGVIELKDLSFSVDGQVVWEIPFDFLTFAGLGVSAHLLNGEGTSIRGTLIEDLLDSLTPGFNLHAGLEYPVTNGIRIYGAGRYEVLGDLQYFNTRFGFQVMIGDNAPGEGRGR